MFPSPFLEKTNRRAHRTEWTSRRSSSLYLGATGTFVGQMEASTKPSLRLFLSLCLSLSFERRSDAPAAHRHCAFSLRSCSPNGWDVQEKRRTRSEHGFSATIARLYSRQLGSIFARRSAPLGPGMAFWLLMLLSCRSRRLFSDGASAASLLISDASVGS
eukprot:scaffold1130_cov195-Pinguiococcus_pyrenoidosus.AAC.39